MILHPNCKVNLGLHVVRKRADGYHDLETIFLPVEFLTDEITIEPSPVFSFSCDGLDDCESEQNIVVKTFRRIQEQYGAGNVRITLQKRIPTGAGLGGGSADAAFVAKALSEMFSLGLDSRQLVSLLSPIGADCPFFVFNRPCLATGIGDVLEPIGLNLSGYELAVVKPAVSVPTALAYSRVVPRENVSLSVSTFDLRQLPTTPVEQWKDLLVNDFEKPVFADKPQIARVKQSLYAMGAAYAAMSGSGSAVLALFEKGKAPTSQMLQAEFADCFTVVGRLP